MNVLVYRVETPCGLGPYRNDSDNWYYETKCNHNSLKRPTPQESSKMIKQSEDFPISNYHFAFYSLSSLKIWFPKSDRKLLYRDGYQVSVYKVPKVSYIKIRKQCLFIKEDSEFIEKIYIDKI